MGTLMGASTKAWNWIKISLVLCLDLALKGMITSRFIHTLPFSPTSFKGHPPSVLSSLIVCTIAVKISQF